MDDIVAKLTEYTVGLDAASLPDSVRDEVRRRLVDSLACAYGGIDSPPVASLRLLASKRGLPSGCLIWGTAQRTTPEVAAIINSAAIRFLDYNDHVLGGHPSDNMAATVAACEWVDADVDTLIAALVVNYEVFGELGRLSVRSGGWDQGTTGSIAAACSASRVFALSVDQTASAIGIAATSVISTRKSRQGQLTMWKGVASAYAAQAGLLAAMIASTGVTAPHDAFTGKYGFCDQISGPFEVCDLRVDKAPRYLFKTSYKYWPVEFDAQPAVWLGRQIRDLFPLETVSHIEVETSEWTWRAIGSDESKWRPMTRETADHSLPFILAVSLVSGGISVDDFSDESIRNSAYSDLMSRISVRPAEDITSAAPEQCLMRATVTSSAGDSLRFEAAEPRGRHTNPMSEEELRAKWYQLVSLSPMRDSAQSMLASLETLDGRRPVRDLFAPLESHT